MYKVQYCGHQFHDYENIPYGIPSLTTWFLSPTRLHGHEKLNKYVLLILEIS
jgi:hypothetical protein